VIALAIRTEKVSDLDGAPEANVGAVLRDYPGQESAKILDVTADQAKELEAKAVKDVVTVELRMPDTSTKTVLVAKKELDAWLGKPQEVLKNASFLRGRRPGFSPSGRNGG
jgi:BioD-like phosphotransacetylase family protein